MKTFYIDTSSSYLYAGISVDQELIKEVKLKLDKELSSFTLPEIKKIFDESKIDPKEIDKIIVVNGPGSFTGIRIGVTIAKTYAWSLQKEIATISSLEAMATKKEDTYEYLVPMIDARRGYVYGAIYRKDGTLILKEQYIKRTALEVAMDDLPGSAAIISNDVFETEKKVLPYDADIEEIIKRFEQREGINPHAVEPNYLKLTEAEENKMAQE